MSHDPRTVLVVDDTPENIDLMKAILAPRYKVKVAINGESALRLVAAAPPDLVLLDVMMPGMDGLEVCRRLRTSLSRRQLPVILVSAGGEFLEAGTAAGADDFVAKPIDAPLVLARVAAALSLAALKRQAAAAAAALRDGRPAAEVAAGLEAALAREEEGV
ncbi:MAG: response regulator [Magnetospirillum sp.]|nr:response regulator [Magnetospirillum sp.]